MQMSAIWFSQLIAQRSIVRAPQSSHVMHISISFHWFSHQHYRRMMFYLLAHPHTQRERLREKGGSVASLRITDKPQKGTGNQGWLPAAVPCPWAVELTVVKNRQVPLLPVVNRAWRLGERDRSRHGFPAGRRAQLQGRMFETDAENGQTNYNNACNDTSTLRAIFLTTVNIWTTTIQQAEASSKFEPLFLEYGKSVTGFITTPTVFTFIMIIAIAAMFSNLVSLGFGAKLQLLSCRTNFDHQTTSSTKSPCALHNELLMLLLLLLESWLALKFLEEALRKKSDVAG
ncbi:hypothetical protein D917_02335 [Trichinella nativa]|uniref:Uncharacterized protein n=1 Tax=Trichinella nativa TaxID=6335 RepID=A0A1Y3EJQ3_9BILA|nr:hypothetical protein D917_02335 [Trichinella nativa]